jgi:5-methyltetrahydropteroyltriglutamate--homocysteine methyltransferase
VPDKVLSNVSGFPRIGAQRELKFATEGLWAGDRSSKELASVSAAIRTGNWSLQRDAGIGLIPSNDFSLYDQMLDTIALVGAVPERYGWEGGSVDLDTYFAMARGRQASGVDVTAMEMTKWFDTNYHYIVPELRRDMRFELASSKPFDEYEEAGRQGVETKPVLIGPLTFLLLGKCVGGDFDRLELLDRLVDIYAAVLERLGEAGARWVQIDEPVLVQDRSSEELEAFAGAFERLAEAKGAPKILVNTYFDHVGEAYPVLAGLPVAGIGVDLVRGERNVDLIEELGWPDDKALFAGVVSGRNVWINDLERSLQQLEALQRHATDVVVSTSCSLLHSPIDKRNEPKLDDEVLSWMSFAVQKLDEVAALSRALDEGRDAVAEVLESNAKALESRRSSPRTQNREVRKRLASVTEADARRDSHFSERSEAQRDRLGLPLFPTTTIGSYPQTSDIRQWRIQLRNGDITEDQYTQLIRDEIERVVRFQDEVGLDVLVHGEPERNDMVQYFAEQMDGYVTMENGWVQSYGSRYVRPPILYGDISRPKPITVDWITFAQSLTDKPLKGMLTGPVTMLMWSFVRDDQPRSETCKQLALAIREEVADLEAADIKVIQVDEPAIREGLPLRRAHWQEYLDWAVFSFRLATSGVRDETQIQTHMCYSEFRDIMDSISALDADVLLIWHVRSQAELLDYWKQRGYDKDIAPGVYDIHSPRVPSAEEMAETLRQASDALSSERLWVAPDCGLKTRRYEEVDPSLRNMVQAARQLREELIPAGR